VSQDIVISYEPFQSEMYSSRSGDWLHVLLRIYYRVTMWMFEQKWPYKELIPNIILSLTDIGPCELLGNTVQLFKHRANFSLFTQSALYATMSEVAPASLPKCERMPPGLGDLIIPHWKGLCSLELDAPKARNSLEQPRKD